MQKIALSEITIPERFRKDPGDIRELAGSFKEYGQLQPIIIDGNNVLAAGWRRISAAAILGWDEIGYERLDDLDEIRRREIELEENLRRKQFDWKEEVAAIAEIHRIRKEDDPKWTTAQTAELIGRGERLAQYAVKLSDNISIPEVAEATTMMGAIQRLTTHEQIKSKLAAAEYLEAKLEWKVIEGDAREKLKELEDESVDCIITDPPFGIELNYRGEKGFNDSPIATLDLIRSVAPDLYRVLKNDCWALIFFDAARMGALITALTSVCRCGHVHKGWPAPNAMCSTCKCSNYTPGFQCFTEVPGIWFKPNKTTGSGRNPSRYMTVAYEAFMLFAKGEPVLMKKGRPNVFAYDAPISGERVHSTQKSAALAQDLVETLTVGGQVVLDPFCGSGTFGVGALRSQRKYIAIEARPSNVEKAKVYLAEALR